MKTGDQVRLPDGRMAEILDVKVGGYVVTDMGWSGPAHSLTGVYSQHEAKRLHDTIEAAAEAAHDRYREITAETSDLGYAFASEREKREWREVVLEVLRAIQEQP